MRRSLTVLGLMFFSVFAYAVVNPADTPPSGTVVNAGGCLKSWAFKSKAVVWKDGWDKKNSSAID